MESGGVQEVSMGVNQVHHVFIGGRLGFNSAVAFIHIAVACLLQSNQKFYAVT